MTPPAVQYLVKAASPPAALAELPWVAGNSCDRGLAADTDEIPRIVMYVLLLVGAD